MFQQAQHVESTGNGLARGTDQSMQHVAAMRDSAPRSVTVLGSTGSVGCNTIDLIQRNPDAFAVEALTAYSNVKLLADQARHLRARCAVVGDSGKYFELKEALSGTGIEAAAGPTAVAEAGNRPAEWVMAAIVGAAGLEATLAAVRRGAVVEIILTASGGPFRKLDRAAMAAVTPAQAVAHPNWDMGAKISVDSATMMNKGLELIEAHHLFGLPESQIEIVVHPQSVIHSLVAYTDGSVLAQLGSPDMRTPIAYALAWPKRMPTPAKRLDLAAIGSLTFEAPDPVRFPALQLAREALKAGGTAPAVLNAANEVAVHAFLKGQIGFLDIAATVERTLELMPVGALASLDHLREVDATAREQAQRNLRRNSLGLTH